MKMVMSISTAAQTTSSSEEEAAVTRGDWFIGGDRAVIDEDGYVHFHGRADDVIK